MSRNVEVVRATIDAFNRSCGRSSPHTSPAASLRAIVAWARNSAPRLAAEFDGRSAAVL